MNRFARTAVVGAAGLLIYAGVVLTVKAGNLSGPPPAPPPRGTKVNFIAVQSVVVNQEQVLQARASLVSKPVLIRFDVIEGDAAFTGNSFTPTDGAGRARRGLVAKAPGKIVVRARCDTAGCEDVMTLQAVAPE